MASLDDILTTQKNGVVAINRLNAYGIWGQATKVIDGTAGATSLLVYTGAGRLYSISVTAHGAATGMVYDSATTAGAATSNQIMYVPATYGVQTGYINFSNGLVVSVGAGLTVAVTYSPATAF